MGKKVVVANSDQNKSYEERYEERTKRIDNLNISELHEYRKSLLQWQTDVDAELKSLGEVPRRRYLVGLRKFVIRPLLTYSKKRISTLNRVLHNGVTKDLAKRFMEVAFKTLPIEVFQQLYGLTVTQEEIELQTIEDIKEFMKTAQPTDIDGNK